MLRYFYLLSLLLYFHISFCYDYLNNDTPNSPRAFNRDGSRNGHRNTRIHKRKAHRKRPLYNVYDNEPVAQFDLASFIQNPDDVSEKHVLGDIGQKGRQKSKDFSEFENFINLNADERKNDGWNDYLGLEKNNLAEDIQSSIPNGNVHDSDNNANNYVAYLDDTTKSDLIDNHDFLTKNMYRDNIIDSDSAHHPEKKGALKNLRFPFFFHNKPQTLISTKDKKITTNASKIHKLNKSQQVNKNNGKALNIENEMIDASDMRYNLYKINKRSYREKLCPECKRIFIAEFDSIPGTRRIPNKIIHNSRQFYQNLKDVAQVTDTKNIKNKDLITPPELREKRQQINLDRERQMKELEEVERKVESVDVNSSAFQKLKINTSNVTLS